MFTAYFSRCSDSSTSTAPPPGTTMLLSSVRFTTAVASWKDRAISSHMYSLGPRRSTVLDLRFLHPLISSTLSSRIFSSDTESACPSMDASNVSSPSKSAMLDRMVAPVAVAIRFMSFICTRRHAMVFDSTKYFRAVSSIPLVVRITLAPALSMAMIRFLVVSSSCSCILPNSSESFTTMVTPSLSLDLRRSISKHAIFASLR
mmetsp:Transcript_12259/g.20920  ORF Transcript_12259/g.20920 Transcript_12259/m.20920 type:complete len:203 (-) Transcript_12259:750-1358(-)